MNLTEIRPYVFPHVKGCPMPIVDQAIVRAAIDFCARSNVWRYQHATVTADGTVTNYSFAPPSGAKVERVLAAWLDGVPINVRNPPDLYGMTDYLTDVSSSTDLVFVDNSQFRLAPYGAGDVDMMVVLKPSRAATTIPDVIFEDHVDTIADKALSILFSYEGEAWSNAPAAQSRESAYMDAVSKAYSRDYQNGPVRTVPPPL